MKFQVSKQKEDFKFVRNNGACKQEKRIVVFSSNVKLKQVMQSTLCAGRPGYLIVHPETKNRIRTLHGLVSMDMGIQDNFLILHNYH